MLSSRPSTWIHDLPVSPSKRRKGSILWHHVSAVFQPVLRQAPEHLVAQSVWVRETLLRSRQQALTESELQLLVFACVTIWILGCNLRPGSCVGAFDNFQFT